MFKSFDADTRLVVLTSGIAIIDEIYDTLNLELKNEYVSQGPNLTENQVNDISKNSSLRKRYVERRDISFTQMVNTGKYEFNNLDLEVKSIQIKIEEGRSKAQKIVDSYSGGNLNLRYMWLIELPDMSKIDVTGDFLCAYNELASLKGCPRSVVGSFHCSNNQLSTLEGSPSRVGGDFYCNYNKLKTLEGAPSRVGGDFECNFNNLITLEGAPSSVGRGFYCNDNKLTTLLGAPSSVGGFFNCKVNKLTTLLGAPSSVGRSFYCNYNKLITLEGSPSSVGGSFECDTNSDLISLKGAPAKIGARFLYPDKFTEEDADTAMTERRKQLSIQQ